MYEMPHTANIIVFVGSNLATFSNSLNSLKLVLKNNSDLIDVQT